MIYSVSRSTFKARDTSPMRRQVQRVSRGCHCDRGVSRNGLLASHLRTPYRVVRMFATSRISNNDFWLEVNGRSAGSQRRITLSEWPCSRLHTMQDSIDVGGVFARSIVALAVRCTLQNVNQDGFGFGFGCNILDEATALCGHVWRVRPRKRASEETGLVFLCVPTRLFPSSPSSSYRP